MNCVSEGEEGEAGGPTEGEGTDPGCGDGTPDLDFAVLEDCPAESMYAQPAIDPSENGADLYPSDADYEVRHFESYGGLSAPVASVTWWGATLDQSLEQCDRTGGDVSVTFYADNNGRPGNVVYSETLTPGVQDTGSDFEGVDVLRFDAVLSQPVDLCTGWVSVLGVGDADCRFSWYSAASGDGSRTFENSIGEQDDSSDDLSLCLAESTTVSHSADPNGDGQFNLSELLRVIQFYNAGEFSCSSSDGEGEGDGSGSSEDGFTVGGGDQSCLAHSTDFIEQDWNISLSELLRLIQLYNLEATVRYCFGLSEDGFCVGA